MFFKLSFIQDRKRFLFKIFTILNERDTFRSKLEPNQIKCYIQAFSGKDIETLLLRWKIGLLVLWVPILINV